MGSALDIRESERTPTAPQRRSPADQFEYKQAQVAAAAKESADLAFIQYRPGATNYTTVIRAQQFLFSDQDSLAVAQGAVPQSLVAVYRFLGGGWELRDGKPLLPADVTPAMGKRTDWGGLLAPAAVQPLGNQQLLTPDWQGNY